MSHTWVNIMCNNNASLELNETRLIASFLENARLFPDQEAVVDGEQSITYAELDAVSNRIAARLQRSYSQTPEQPVKVVGVLLPRSIGNVACWLGAAKAGIAYAPIGRDWPSARIQGILRRCSIKVVLTGGDCAAIIPRDLPVEVLDVADFLDMPDNAPAIEIRVQKSRDEESLPLYVIHTSGSTGEPKSVALTHANTYAVLQNPSEYGVRKHDRMAHVIAVTFDLSMMEVWGSLLHAGTIIVTETEVSLDAERLKSHISRYDICWAILSTGVFNILSTQDVTTLKSMRDVCICGEMPNREAIMKVCAACPGTTIHNCYGPAECTIYVTRESITPKSLEPAVVPAGRPIAAAGILIVDDDMRPLPPGSVGEVLISGPCVGLGYIGDAKRTGRAFVHLPYLEGPVYRTGDYGTLDEHGSLTVFGRKDNQIKISGRRVELGEICSTAMRAPDVKMAFISLTQGADRELVAYVTPESPAMLTDRNLRARFVAGLKDHMLGRLPEYMVPRHYILVDSLPLNTHGKVDRSRLPTVPTPTLVEDGSILGMFREVLGNCDYRLQDSFFDAGGTSIKAARLIGAIRQATQVPVPFSLLLEDNTAAKVQAYVESARNSGVNTFHDAPKTEPVRFSFPRRTRRPSSLEKAVGDEQ